MTECPTGSWPSPPVYLTSTATLPPWPLACSSYTGLLAVAGTGRTCSCPRPLPLLFLWPEKLLLSWLLLLLCLVFSPMLTSQGSLSGLPYRNLHHSSILLSYFVFLLWAYPLLSNASMYLTCFGFPHCGVQDSMGASWEQHCSVLFTAVFFVPRRKCSMVESSRLKQGWEIRHMLSLSWESECGFVFCKAGKPWSFKPIVSFILLKC